MGQHSVKINDKLYVKLKAYCDLNNESIYKLSNEAIEDYLNRIKFGDAPFFVGEVTHENRQNCQESPVNLENFAKELPKDEVKIEKNTNPPEIVIDSIKADENGAVTVKARKITTIDHIEQEFKINETPKPRKRRL